MVKTCGSKATSRAFDLVGVVGLVLGPIATTCGSKATSRAVGPIAVELSLLGWWWLLLSGEPVCVLMFSSVSLQSGFDCGAVLSSQVVSAPSPPPSIFQDGFLE